MISNIHTFKMRILSGASLGVLGALLAAPAAAQPVQLGPVSVQDETSAYQAESADPRRTAPLLDTPQTITVITQQLIADQNLLNLRDILANTVPGITFTAGEGGGGYGDGINLRGYSATSDITVDGARDSAQYTRSDPFDIAQIEVVNGADSVYSGAGSVGGNINLVTKVPVGADATVISAGAGTDNYGRLTLDAERTLGDGISVRLNAMLHNNDAPGRDVEKYSRYGLAPSIGFGLNSATRFTLSYFFQHDDNIPQYGVPYYVNAYNDGPLPGSKRSNYYGYSNIDRQRINSHAVTGILNHQIADDLSVRNLTRWSRVTQHTIVDPPQGTACLTSGIDVSTGAACTPAGFYTPGGPRGTERDSLNTGLYNQTDFTWQGATGGLEHTLVVGMAFQSEDFALAQGNVERTATGDTPSYPPMRIANPDHVYTGPINYFQTRQQDGHLESQSVYAFDTIRIIRRLDLNAGLRYDHDQGTNTTVTYDTGILSSQGQVFRNEDDLLSYRAGLVYKPVEEASLYVAYGNSKTPSQSAVNGSCAADTCNVRPETAVNYEAGVKWDPAEGLSLAAAIFRNERSNYKVPSNDPTEPDQVLDGASRVDGVALTANGRIMPGWDVFFTYTYLRSKVLQAASNYCLAHPSDPGCAAALAGSGRGGAVAGNPLTNTPTHALNLWTTYRILPRWTAGAGLAYQGDYYLNNASGPLYKAGEYVTSRVMLSYDVRDDVTLQLNVNNLFDETYYTRIRNDGWATPGDGRNLAFTLNYRL